ncbi:lipopolysaccharide biosynthesis protein [Duganella sp. HH105]|uniref:lipopolysaccharide biosynthesis protein n=1 Tax=Duganella sp. HH105 TaxID=1781067 RepID=UPI0008938391|nr:oligosaccharide flippase family protein [Duganella sp. HH105]OEZ61622.1 polysaccharide biosynthesis protein [Duganella sp. HH105]
MSRKAGSNLFKNSVLSFLLNVSSTAIGFFAIPITLKIMGIEHYGSFIFVQSLAMIAFTLTTVQYWQGLLVEIPGKVQSLALLKRQVMRSVSFEALGGLAAALLIIVISLPIFEISQINGFGRGDMLLAVVSMLLPSLGSLVAFYRLTNQYQILLMAGVCTNLLRLLLLFGASRYYPTTSAVIVCYAAPELFRLICLAAYMFWYQKPGAAAAASDDVIDEGRILSAGKWGSVQAIADLPIANIDKVLVALVLSPEALGIYNILKRLYAIISMATTPVYANSIPEFAQKINTGDSAGAFALWRKTIWILLPVSTVIGMTAFFSRSLWIPFIFRGLAEHSQELLIIILAAIVAGSFITTHAFYWALGKKRETTAITVGTNLLYLFFLFTFSKFFGVSGAIGAFLLHVTLAVAIKVTLLLKERRAIV